MGLYRKRQTSLVVSPSPWSVNTVLLVAVFVVTSTLVYHWAQTPDRAVPPEAAHTAAVSIHHAEMPRTTGDRPHHSPSDDFSARVAQQIRSHDNLEAAVLSARRAAGAETDVIAGDDSPATIGRLQEGVSVEVDGAGTGQLRVRVAYTDDNRERASRLLHAVAQQYAGTVRRQWKWQTESAHADAVAAADQARLQWQHAEVERQEYVERFLREQEQDVQRVAPAEVPPAEPTPRTPPPAAEDPEWSRLFQRRGELERRRSELLVHRMPAHPEVQEIEHELADLRRALEGIPQGLTPRAAGSPTGLQPAERPAAGSPPPAARAGIDPVTFARKHGEARRQLDRLARQAEQARERYEQLAMAERVAWSAYLREPEIELAFASPRELASPEATVDHLLSTSLLAGLAMMVGVGMFAAGAAMEPTLTSAAQVASLGVPVVATVTLPGLKSTGPGRHQVWLRLASCLGGAVLMAGCIGLLYRAVAG